MTNTKSRENWVVLLFSVYTFIWCVLAISPVNRFNWALENILIFFGLVLLVFVYKRIPLSNTSYTLLTIFLVLHTIGAHYSYQTPLDAWLDLKRAYYDRIVHFSFGFCFLLPAYQIIRFRYSLLRRSSILFANISLLAASSLFELLEVWVVYLIAPQAGDLFLGLQGDPWDAQHDMQIALLGSIFTSCFLSLYLLINEKTTDSP
jgi:putative membrane protein